MSGDGPTLEERIRQDGRIPILEALAITRDIATALATIHAAGLVHGDVRPASVRATDAGVVLGKSGRAPAPAPEFALSRRPDALTDLYALGATLYEMLTGQPPFIPDPKAHLLETLTPPKILNPLIPDAVEGLIRRLLDKDPAKRPSSVHELLAFLSPQIVAVAPSPPRTRLLQGIAIAAAACLVSVIVLVALAIRKRSTPVPPILDRPAPPVVQEEREKKGTPIDTRTETAPKFIGLDSVLLIKDGTYVVGAIRETADGFEVTTHGKSYKVEGSTVAKWIKTPFEFLEGSEPMVDAAIELLQVAGRRQDRNEAWTLLTNAKELTERSRTALLRARSYFPGSDHAWLDDEIARAREVERQIQQNLDTLPVVKGGIVDEPLIETPEPGGLPEEVRLLFDSADKRRDAPRRRRGRESLRLARGAWNGGDLRAALVIFLTRSEDDWGATPALQAYFDKFLSSNPKTWSGKDHLAAATFLADKIKQLPDRKGLDPLLLFFAGHLNEGFNAPAEVDRKKFETLALAAGLARSGDQWGTRPALLLAEYGAARRRGDAKALDNFRKSGDASLRYAVAVAMYEQGAWSIELYRRAIAAFREVGGSDAMITHVEAIMKLMKDAAPPPPCKLCKGAMKVDLVCGSCEGTGQFLTPGARAPTKKCSRCDGKGKFINSSCPRCGATGREPGTGAKPIPTLHSIADVLLCPMCTGGGVLFLNPVLVCPDCFGAGCCVTPHSDPGKVVARPLKESDTVRLFPWGFGTRERRAHPLFTGSVESLSFPQTTTGASWTCSGGVLSCETSNYSADTTARFDTVTLPSEFVVSLSFALSGNFDTASAVGVEFGPSKVTPKDLSYTARYLPGKGQVEILERREDGWTSLGSVPFTLKAEEVGRWNTFEVRVKSGQATIAVNGAAVLGAKLPWTFEASPVGLRVRGATARFTNLFWMSLSK